MTAKLYEAEELATNFLSAMQARDTKLANSYLADDFMMVFPGNAKMTTLEELLSWASERYRFVRKVHEAREVFENDHTQIVYIRGTLSGEWPDSTPFEGVRFIDRFEIRDGKITRQDVWNDIAEVRTR